MPGRHNAVIVDRDLVNAIVLVSAVELSQNHLAEIVEFGHVARLSVTNERVDLVGDYYVVLAQFANESVLVDVADHVVLDVLGHLGLALVGSRVVDDRAILLLRASMMDDVKGGYGRDCISFVGVEGANLLLDLCELCGLGILSHVVAKLGRAADLLLDLEEQLVGVNLALAVVLVDAEQTLVLCVGSLYSRESKQFLKVLPGSQILKYFSALFYYISG